MPPSLVRNYPSREGTGNCSFLVPPSPSLYSSRPAAAGLVMLVSGAEHPWSPSYLFQPAALLLLLLDALLTLGQQLTLVLLVLSLLLFQLLPPQRLRALLVGQLKAQEVPSEGGFAR